VVPMMANHSSMAIVRDT